ncbi:prepilin-type N-terminal cleavage/methylation domain-containing protein [Opitutaceae bacterium TAV1]|nr:N-terminal cleavage protein [Opitutaceae bacterium TAV5]EIP98223.1 prepilin-type N-terminal cleavage/methylation domain-containing protein [Opitutaceae bacterium TAV1]
MDNPNMHRIIAPVQPRSAGFTLIELLTVIAIIGILAAIIIPTVGKVRKTARDTQCRSNLHQIGVAVTLYAQENNNKFPPGNDWKNPPDGMTRLVWINALIPYLNSGAPTYEDKYRSPITSCPSAERPVNAWDNTQYSANQYLTSDGYTPASLSVITRPSETVFAADGVIRANSLQAHAVLRNTILGISDTTPDQPIASPSPDPEEGISYRHGTDTTQVVMVDASVRAFKKGTLKSRNFSTSY